MKIKIRNIFSILLCVMLTFVAAFTCSAVEQPDVNRECSVTFTMKYANSAVAGGSLTIYRVGEVKIENADAGFELTYDFAASGVSLDNFDDIQLARELEAFVAEHSVNEFSTKYIDDSGVVSFYNLPVGLYLVVQNTAASGYKAISPFLISLPYLENGVYKYDLTAEPKTQIEPENETTNPVTTTEPVNTTNPITTTEPVETTEPENVTDPVTTTNPENITEPETTTEPDSKPESTTTPVSEPTSDIPKTGQLWWPVPMLVCIGLVLIIIGFGINRRKRSDEA